MLLQIHQINPCCKRKKAHTRLESVGSSNVSVVTTSAAPPPPTTTSSCPEGGRNCNDNIWGRAMMKVSQSGCCFRKLISISTATQFDKTVIRVKHHFSEPYFLIHLEEIITTHSSTHLLLYLSGYGRYFQEVSWPERVTGCVGTKTRWGGARVWKHFKTNTIILKRALKDPGGPGWRL